MTHKQIASEPRLRIDDKQDRHFMERERERVRKKSCRRTVMIIVLESSRKSATAKVDNNCGPRLTTGESRLPIQVDNEDRPACKGSHHVSIVTGLG